MTYQRVLEWLQHRANDDGSWGYLSGQPGVGEATTYAVAAGAKAPLSWLETAEVGWASLLLPAVLARVEGSAFIRDRGLRYILSHRGKSVENGAALATFDATLIGWSYYPETFSWVEPTSWALLSLAAEGKRDHERAVEGRALLVDRQCRDGGWNYGNPDVLGAELESYPHSTAWAVMALPAGEPVSRGLKRLEEGERRPSVWSLSLGILALLAHRRDVSDWVQPLLNLQREDGSFGDRIDSTALAACALRAATLGEHPFVQVEIPEALRWSPERTGPSEDEGLDEGEREDG